jgi:hypothetical protein
MSQSKFHSYTNSILDNFALNLTQYGEPKTQKTKLGIRTGSIDLHIFNRNNSRRDNIHESNFPVPEH